MVALRMVGLAVLAAAVAGFGALAIYHLIGVRAEGRARQAAIKVGEAAGTVVATGNPQSVRIEIPSGYTMRFVGNHIWVNGYKAPSGGLALSFADGLPELGAGEYELVVSIENAKLVVWT